MDGVSKFKNNNDKITVCMCDAIETEIWKAVWRTGKTSKQKPKLFRSGTASLTSHLGEE